MRAQFSEGEKNSGPFWASLSFLCPKCGLFSQTHPTWDLVIASWKPRCSSSTPETPGRRIRQIPETSLLAQYLLHVLGLIPYLTGGVSPAVSPSPMQTGSMRLMLSLPLARKAGSCHLKGSLNFPEVRCPIQRQSSWSKQTGRFQPPSRWEKGEISQEVGKFFFFLPHRCSRVSTVLVTPKVC